jgi:PAS domain S-box-containing protein
MPGTRASTAARVVDWAIPPELRDDPDVRLRARVLVGAAQTLFVVALLCVLLCIAEARPVAAIGLVAAASCHASAIFVLRGRRSIETATLLLCFGIVMCTAWFALQAGGLYVTVTAWVACVPLLTAFLAGGRNAMLAAAAVVATMFGVWLVHTNGAALQLWEPPPLEAPSVWIASIAAHFAVALFAWQYSAERATTLERIETTVAGLEMHRDRLASVLESSDAAIISTDRELRVTALNTAGRALAQRMGSRLTEGDPLPEKLPERHGALWRERFARVLAGETLTFEHHSPRLDRDYDISIRPVGEGAPTGLVVFAHDVTDRKEAARTLAEARREMIELARVAGMADVATGVLHNVGNALNSAKTSAHVVAQRIDDLGKPRLARLVALLPEDPAALARFVVEDPRGGRIVCFLQELAAQAQRTLDDAKAEIERLDERLDHIQHIVTEQQQLATRKRVWVEECDPRDLVCTAVDLTAGQGSGDVVVEQAPDVPKLRVDRHKVIQILGNLVANARESARDAGVAEPRIAIRTARTETGIRIAVEDNGLGMEAGTLARVFEQGFTTKSYGHGFGLHTAANQTEELGGSVTARSDGPGTGAVFTLDLPLQPPRRATG